MILTEEADEALGRQVVWDGLLQVLRERLGLSRMIMAEMLYATIPSYANWEINPLVELRAETAKRIGRFYRAASQQLDDLKADGVALEEYLPFHIAATRLHTGSEVLLQRYRRGEIEAMDLGILGLWVHQDHV